MRKQDQLLLLIKSLTPAEKKYFVQSAQADGQTKSYLQLYEALLKADTYNADDLSVQLKKKKTDLANEKKYLEYLLLKSLRAFFEKDARVNLYNALSSVAVLCSKKLYSQALGIILKAKPEARRHNNFTLYAELCFMEGTVYMYLDSFTSQSGRDKIARTKEEALNALLQTKQSCELENIQSDAMGLMERFNFLNPAAVTKKADELLQMHALTIQYDNPRLKSIKNEALGLLYRLKNDFVKSLSCLEENLALMEKFPVESEVNEYLYYWQLNNLFHSYLQLNYFDKAAQQIDYIAAKKYHRLGLKNQELDKRFAPALIEKRLLLSLAMYMDKKAGKADLLKAIAGFERDGARAHSGLTLTEQLITLMTVAKLYLLTGQPDKALNFTGTIINNINDEYRPPLQARARVTALLAHYELGNYRILKSLVLSAKRFLKKHKLLTEVETTTFQYILKLATPESHSEKAKLLTGLLKAYRTFEKNPALKANVLQANVIDWAERNLEKLKRG